MSNFIIPLSSLPPVASINSQSTGAAKSSPLEGLPFADLLQNAMADITATGEQSKAGLYNLAVGGSDDLHTGAIDALKSSTAISYASGIASSVVRAYSELMRMQI